MNSSTKLKYYPAVIRVMSEKQNETNAVENSSTEQATEKKAKEVKLTFDKLTIDQQAEIAEKVIAVKKPTLDLPLLYKELKDGKVNKIPSDKLVNLALQGRSAVAGIYVAYKKTKDLIPQVYESAKNEGFTPFEARRFCEIVIAKDGALLSLRTIRNYLPEEAKNAKFAELNAQKPQLTEQEKAENKEAAAASTVPKDETRQFIIPVMWVEKIAEFAKKHPKEACLVILNKDNTIKKIDQQVIVEEKGQDGKFHKVNKAAEDVKEVVAKKK